MDTTRAIGFAAGFQHCIHTSSYWVSLAIVIGICALLWALLEFVANKANFDPSNLEKVLLIAAVLAISCAIFGRPAQVGANTSVTMAAKGNYLGY